ncbi:dTDP-3-amino-2,3, 6-trideoxy-4-keto-D-glucose/dTDP-3-amino-3,4, 6-trideoxy-alpha-D-glucose/dTDP-2,6-dideoxy-D-kanosamine transaminase [Methylophilaceae bacterium]|nr:dTDP-3-amino-2,3, 6-trideoxy-4-keto-D-glucose/dTDP-3-amino-3,4, 6-trideoxy-alpha-D-glucose/dTDP-2,6-dideoxy-D-kanosamine transaminase [Methylophilaceae bacterium]
MNDFRVEPEDLRVAELAALDRVLRSGWYVLGNEVKAFEAAWAERCGLTYAVGVGNGMDAIEIGLRAMGIGKGDEVITTPMTAFATVLAIIRAGASPVLADIDPDTALLDPVSVERCIGPRTKAVLLVHLYGQVREMEHWTALCEKHGIALLEDCAQSHLARWNGKVAGSFGRFGAYSFYPTKNLGALGDAGALVSSDDELAQRAAVLRNYGQSVRYHHTELGLNSRLDELQAALLMVRLERLDSFTERRRQIAKMYSERITNPRVRLLAEPIQAENHVYHLFVVICDERDQLGQHLKFAGVETYVHYPLPVHSQEPCKEIHCDPNGLAMAESHAAKCLSVPCHPQMSDMHIATVIDAINAFK